MAAKEIVYADKKVNLKALPELLQQAQILEFPQTFAQEVKDIYSKVASKGLDEELLDLQSLHRDAVLNALKVITLGGKCCKIPKDARIWGVNEFIGGYSEKLSKNFPEYVKKKFEEYKNAEINGKPAVITTDKGNFLLWITPTRIDREATIASLNGISGDSWDQEECGFGVSIKDGAVFLVAGWRD